MDAVMMAKYDLRIRMIAQRDALAITTREVAAAALARRLDAILKLAPDLRQDAVIAGFLAIQSEIDVLPLMRAFQSRGYRLALPRMTAGNLVFHAFEREDDLVPGPFGTREPPVDAPVVVPDLFLTPLLAFDDTGGRLGYGKGFYDRAFAACPHARRIGIAHACQRVAKVPCAAHDVALHAVIAV